LLFDAAAEEVWVARALIGQAVRWSREQRARELVAWVAEPNTAARRLYARVGFRPAGARQPLPSNPAVDELLLRLPLDSLATVHEQLAV
jgi:RimJ/RimL family protein N-acetyltransferase